jgi:plastocyanin
MARRAAQHLYLVAYLVTLSCFCSFSTLASEISGRIIVQKNLDKSAIVPIYDLRGIAVHGGSPDKPGNFKGVAVWLESSTSKPADPVTVAMRQQNRRIEPELLVVPVGSTVEFPNLDPIFHNIFSLSKARAFDLGYYTRGKSRSVTFPRSGIVQVYCHVHPNMYGAIVVTSSRWFGKPAPDGSFSWHDVPPGAYKLMAWQKFAGFFARDVVVPRAGALSITMAIPEDPENR